MIIELLNSIDERFGLLNLVRAGVIRPIDIRDREIFFKYDIFRKKGLRSYESIDLVCDEYRLSRTTVKTAIKRMSI